MMNGFFAALLGPVWVLEVHLEENGGHAVCGWHCLRGRAPELKEYLPEQVARSVCVATIRGDGVVSKAVDSEIGQRVRGDDATFVCDAWDGTVRFVRRERLQSLLSELSSARVYPQRLFVDRTPAQAGETFFEGIAWRRMVRPTAEGASLAQAFVRRVGLPVSGLFLLLLTAGNLLAPRLNLQREALRRELTVRERTASASASVTARQRAVLAQFAARPRVSHALLCDRIGGAVPEGIVLRTLGVEPLTQRFEAGRPLRRLEHTVLIGGRAGSSADVSAFVQRLGETGCCRAVRLAHVGRERDGDGLAFRIECAL